MLPLPSRIYVPTQADLDCISPLTLHPLAIYQPETDDVLLLNARRDRQRTEYLSYTTGRTIDRKDLVAESRSLLARILGGPVEEAQLEAWAARSRDEEVKDAPPDEPEPAERPLRCLGEFELLSELGRGSMGVVYRAWQPSLGRQVALKRTLRAGDPKTEARFQREIRALGRVDHPNLVKIFTSGFDVDQWFFAMELVEGATLGAVCEKLQNRSPSAAGIDLATWQESLSIACEEARKAEKTLSDPGRDAALLVRPSGTRTSASSSGPAPSADGGYVREIIELMRQAALAAHALHEAKVVHRDIKPGNIMLTADGSQAVLMDLGLAQLADDAQGKLTRTRQFVGTLRYASPEQVLSVGGVDRRSDIYSLGASLWELLTLRPLYDANEQTPTPELMCRITSAEPDPVRKYLPGVARDLEAVVHKCLEKDPGHRYATAADLAQDLGRWQRGELVSAQPLTTGYVLSKIARQHRKLIAAVAVLIVALLIGTTAEVHRINLRGRRAGSGHT